MSLQVPSSKPPLPSPEDAATTQPLLAPVTIAANLCAFLAWNTKSVGALATIVFLINLVVGLWGLWAVSRAQLPGGAQSLNEVRCRLSLPTQALSQRQPELINILPHFSLVTRLLPRPKKRLCGRESDSLNSRIVVPV